MAKQKKGATHRVTICISEKLENQVRVKQAELLLKTKKNVSFSSVMNQLVRKGLAA